MKFHVVFNTKFTTVYNLNYVTKNDPFCRLGKYYVHFVFLSFTLVRGMIPLCLSFPWNKPKKYFRCTSTIFQFMRLSCPLLPTVTQTTIKQCGNGTLVYNISCQYVDKVHLGYYLHGQWWKACPRWQEVYLVLQTTPV